LIVGSWEAANSVLYPLEREEVTDMALKQNKPGMA